MADGTVSDNLALKTGFREFNAGDNGGTFLCAEKITVRGTDFIECSGDTGAGLSCVIENGFNAVRPSPEVLSERFLSLCDKKGLLVFARTPFAGEALPLKQRNAKQQMLEIIKQSYNHPCVVCLDIWDEAGGAGGTDEAGRALSELAGIAKSVDSTRYTACTQSSSLPVSSSLFSVTDFVFCRLPSGEKETREWLEKWHSFNPEKKLAVICEANIAACAERPWLQGVFISSRETDDGAASECFGLDDRLGEVFAGEEAKNLIRAGFGTRLEVLFSPLAKPVYAMKAGTALKLMKRAGMSDDTAAKLEGYLKSIKK
jgi:hypothetical protein